LGSQVEPTSTCQPSNNGTTYVISDIASCAARYNAFYQVDGIFVDEFGAPATGASDAAVQSFYTQLYDNLKSVNASWQIVGNPGTAISASLLRNGANGGADRLVTFENTVAAFPGAPQNPAFAAVSNASLINIIYGVDDPALLDSLIAEIAARNVGGLFITNDTLPNPYDTLPPYFAAQVAAVARFNALQNVPEPGTLGIVGFGVMALGLARRRKK
jgi:Spherulation-specific family 4/PEP-CTERM motif